MLGIDEYDLEEELMEAAVGLSVRSSYFPRDDGDHRRRFLQPSKGDGGSGKAICKRGALGGHIVTT